MNERRGGVSHESGTDRDPTVPDPKLSIPGRIEALERQVQALLDLLGPMFQEKPDPFLEAFLAHRERAAEAQRRVLRT